MRMSSSSWLQSGGSESTTAWKSSASAMARGTLAREGLGQQEQVERDDQRGHDAGGERGRTSVAEAAHDVLAPGQQHQRHQRERDAERQHDLADHERVAGV